MIPGNICFNISGNGAVASSESVAVSADGIVNILNAGFAGHHDQATIQLALQILRDAASASAPGTSPVTITDSTFSQPTYNDFIDGED